MASAVHENNPSIIPSERVEAFASALGVKSSVIEAISFVSRQSSAPKNKISKTEISKPIPSAKYSNFAEVTKTKNIGAKKSLPNVGLDTFGRPVVGDQLRKEAAASIGSFVEKHRTAREMTRDDLGKKAGFTGQTIRNIEMGLFKSMLPSLIEVLRILDLDLKISKAGKIYEPTSI